jgi:hypothetical protein
MRDPRAVWNSQRKSRRVGSRVPIGLSIRHFIASWKIFAKLALAGRNDPLVYVVNYEQLTEHPEEAISGVHEWLEVVKGRGVSFVSDIDNYAKRIPDDQQHLHSNVERAPLLARTSAWQIELPSADRFEIERRVESELVLFGFESSRGTAPSLMSRCVLELGCVYWRVRAKCEQLGGSVLRLRK